MKKYFNIEKEVVHKEYFEKFNLGPLELKNRFVLPPMCTYNAKNGYVNMDHMVHYTSLAKGGSSLVIVEATSINNEGVISDNDLILSEPKHVKYLEKVSSAIKENGAKAAIQLAHAGRKSQSEVHAHRGVSEIKFQEEDQEVIAYTTEELDNIVLDFTKAAVLAQESGFDAVEIHAAHGYLLHQSLSPITNTRTDKYSDKKLLISRVLKNVSQNINIPVILRVSATEYTEKGYDLTDVIDVINMNSEYIDIVHVSSGGGVKDFNILPFPGYQLDMASFVKIETKKPVIAVGLLHSPEIINYALFTGKADAIAIGRASLDNPNYITKLKND